MAEHMVVSQERADQHNSPPVDRHGDTTWHTVGLLCRYAGPLALWVSSKPCRSSPCGAQLYELRPGGSRPPHRQSLPWLMREKCLHTEREDHRQARAQLLGRLETQVAL